MTSLRDELIADAFARTGLRDFGEDDFLDALDSQLNSTLSESRISPVGTAMNNGALVHCLCQHLRMEEYFKRYPEIDAQQVQSSTSNGPRRCSAAKYAKKLFP